MEERCDPHRVDGGDLHTVERSGPLHVERGDPHRVERGEPHTVKRSSHGGECDSHKVESVTIIR